MYNWLVVEKEVPFLSSMVHVLRTKVVGPVVEAVNDC